MKNKYARVIVLVHDALSHCALEVYEVLTVFNLQSGQNVLIYVTRGIIR